MMPPGIPAGVPLDEDRLVAAVEVIGRGAANGLELGWTNDDDDPLPGYWYATASWRGVKVIVEQQFGPAEAAEELALKVIAGGQCVHCGRMVTARIVDDAVSLVYSVPGHPRLDPAALAEFGTGDLCLWRRAGRHWLRGCDGAHGAPPGGLSREQRRRQDRAKRLRR